MVKSISKRQENFLGVGWSPYLLPQFKEFYMKELSMFVTERRNKGIVYPAVEDVFKAFYTSSPQKIRVVILGQDPYINGEAHGIAFGVKAPDDVPISPSLRNIFKEVSTDVCEGGEVNCDRSLESWVKQDVMLLNTILTVDKGKPLSHARKGWEIFTTKAIQVLNNIGPPRVFMLWGRNAQKYEEHITNSKHLILKANHPASEAYGNKGKDRFFGCKHFSKCNEFLEYNYKDPVVWAS